MRHRSFVGATASRIRRRTHRQVRHRNFRISHLVALLLVGGTIFFLVLALLIALR